MTGERHEPAGPLDSTRQAVPALSPSVVGVCQRYDAAWQAGLRPRIEEFLAGFPERERPPMLRELLAREVAHRLRLGERPTQQEYLARLSGCAELIDSAFATAAPSPTESTSELPSTEQAPSEPTIDGAGEAWSSFSLLETELIPGAGSVERPVTPTDPMERETTADRRETAYPQVEYNTVSFRIARTCAQRP